MMNIIPDIASIVDEEWEGVSPRPSQTGDVERVIYVPGEQRGPQGFYQPRPRYWLVTIGGRDWGIRPTDPIKQTVLDMFATHFSIGPYQELRKK